MQLFSKKNSKELQTNLQNENMDWITEGLLGKKYSTEFFIKTLNLMVWPQNVGEVFLQIKKVNASNKPEAEKKKQCEMLRIKMTFNFFIERLLKEILFGQPFINYYFE